MPLVWLMNQTSRVGLSQSTASSWMPHGDRVGGESCDPSQANQILIWNFSNRSRRQGSFLPGGTSGGTILALRGHRSSLGASQSGRLTMEGSAAGVGEHPSCPMFQEQLIPVVLRPPWDSPESHSHCPEILPWALGDSPQSLVAPRCRSPTKVVESVLMFSGDGGREQSPGLWLNPDAIRDVSSRVCMSGGGRYRSITNA